MANDYLAFLEQTARKYGVPLAEARAIYERETASGRNVRRSPAGALGQMQLMPGTAREMGVDPNDPYQNIEGGIRYYAQQRQRFGDPALAAAAYNAGPGRVARAGNSVPNIPETRSYVANFLRDIGQVRPSQPAAASATVPPATQGTTPMPVQPPLGGLAAAAPAQDAHDPYAEARAAREGLMRLAQRQQAAAQEGSPDFKAAEDRIKQQFAGPTTSDRLWALSQALLSPKPYRGFAGTMYNLSKSFGGLNERASEAEKSRAQALAQLRDTYAQRASAAELAALKARGELAEFGIESAEKRAKALEPKYTWDETSQRFVSPQTPVPTAKTGVLNGRKVIQYTDGTLRVANPDGSMEVYSADGTPMGTLRAGAK